MSDVEPRPLSSSLDAILRSLRAPDRRQVAGLFGGWDHVVGDQVATHVQPVRLDEGVLVVEVDDPAWATQIRLLTPRIIERLAEVAGVAVERVEVVVARRR
jgi:predicted nucleic acid-binding Zn ribbon protein